MKKRKILLPIFALVVACSGLTMVACSDKGNSADTYASYQEMITTFKENDNLFKSKKLNDYNSNFYFNNFNYKNSSGTKIDEDNNYQMLNAIGMNFIEEYYILIDGLGNYNYNSLDKSIKNLVKAYDNLQVECENLVYVDNDADYEIYNGYSTRYKWEAKAFVDQVYDSALTLADFLVEKVGYIDLVGQEITPPTEDATEEEIENYNNELELQKKQNAFYIDYQNLLIANDFKVLFIDSSSGQKLNSEVTNAATNALVNFTQIISNETKMLTLADFQKFEVVIDAFNNERQTTLKALKEFDFYQFATDYDSNILSYEKEEKYCAAYYRQLQKYFSETNNFIENYRTYISTNIYNVSV